jgi:lipid-A-disaccharide synthase-like uncharacterized protein
LLRNDPEVLTDVHVSSTLDYSMRGYTTLFIIFFFHFVVQILTTKIKGSSVSQKRYFYLIFTVEKADLKTATFPRS